MSTRPSPKPFKARIPAPRGPWTAWYRARRAAILPVHFSDAMPFPYGRQLVTLTPDGWSGVRIHESARLNLLVSVRLSDRKKVIR